MEQQIFKNPTIETFNLLFNLFYLRISLIFFFFSIVPLFWKFFTIRYFLKLNSTVV